MLTDLKFVQGAVAKKDFVPALSHFCIKGGRITGYNGRLALSSPIKLDIEAAPKAEAMVKAIEACKEVVAIHMTPTNRLAIQSGRFKAFIECTTEAYPELRPEGRTIELRDDFLPSLEVVAPFIAEDASRQWAMGVLFRDQSVYATNNITIVEKWLGYQFPHQINIPKYAVQELLRIKTPPISMQVTENDATFHYPGGRWMKTQLYSVEWPDVKAILRDDAPAGVPVPQYFSDALESLIPFTDAGSRAYLSSNLIATAREEGDGASVEVPGFDGRGCFNMAQLRKVAEVAKTIVFFEKAAVFYGTNLRGVMMGMRIA